MSSAADIITFVGVPLTVWGVLPISFNTAKMSRVRYQLLNSIPRQFVPSYKFFLDPANGKVIVVAHTLICTHPGPWIDQRSGPRYTKREMLSSVEIRIPSYLLSFLDFSPFLSNTFQVSLVADAFASVLFWFLSTFREKGAGGDQEAVIDLPVLRKSALDWRDLKMKTFELEAPRLLRRPWMEVALRCGFGLKSYTDPYYREGGSEVRLDVDLDMHVRDPTPMMMRWKDFIWFALSISVDPLDLRQMKPKFTLEDRHVRLALRRRGHKHTSEDPNQLAEIMQGTRTSDRMDIWIRIKKKLHYSIRQALAWNHTMCFSNSDPKSPRLSYQQLGQPGKSLLPHDVYSSADSASNLEPKDCSTSLAMAITWLFYRHGCSADEQTIPVTQQLLEIQEQSLCYLDTLDDAGVLQSRVLGLSYTSIDGSTSPAEFLLNLFKCVKATIEQSDFVKDWRNFRGTVRTRQQTNVNDQRLCLSEDGIESLVKMQGGLTDQVSLQAQVQPHPPLTSSTESTSFRLMMSMMTSYDAFAKLKNSFDPHLQQTDDEKPELQDEAEDTTLLAHILLAVSDWSELPKAHWPLDEKVNASICKILDSSSFGDDTKPEDVSAMLPVLEEGLKASEFGIYTSRKSLTVPELLNWDKAPEFVYLH
ncbi:hypothetical protein HDK90DRAFT_462373 [Phyllosticta capitalensis]|uniref:Uncharacterized protein n=1 Tax=Phyllosticta capitalensis TaxID=121624 RepID=A0ABR1YYK3_9PEZI